MWDYARVLPITEPKHIVTLGEGATPLLEAAATEEHRLYWKNETCNPTGSQKDRAISVSLSKGKEAGASRVILASTGSSGLACAAYSARAGLACVVLVPEGTPPERSIVMELFGAIVVEVPGPFKETARLLDLLQNDPSWYLASTNRRTNPYQAEGVRTIAFEIVNQLGRAPDWLVVPVGGGGTLSGIYRGFCDLRALGLIEKMPRFAAVQPAGLNTVEQALARGIHREADLADIPFDTTRDTVMNNLKSGRRSDIADVVAAVQATNGVALAVTDEDALDWQGRLARAEGIFSEPSGAAAAAAVASLISNGIVKGAEAVVAVITGSGFRQMAVLPESRRVMLPAHADPDALERAFASRAFPR
jgi:threonine synthase